MCGDFEDFVATVKRAENLLQYMCKDEAVETIVQSGICREIAYLYVSAALVGVDECM